MAAQGKKLCLVIVLYIISLFFFLSYLRLTAVLVCRPPSVDGKGDSQRNSLEDSFRLEQRPNSMTG